MIQRIAAVLMTAAIAALIGSNLMAQSPQTLRDEIHLHVIDPFTDWYIEAQQRSRNEQVRTFFTVTPNEALKSFILSGDTGEKLSWLVDHTARQLTGWTQEKRLEYYRKVMVPSRVWCIAFANNQQWQTDCRAFHPRRGTNG